MSFGAMTWKVYIAPMISKNVFGSYVDVTNFVDSRSLGSINIKTEQSDFTVGVAENSSITLKLKNDSGIFNDELSQYTMFTYKRAGSKVKVTYYEGLDESKYGSAIYGDSVYGNEVQIYEGVISSESARQEVESDFLSFSVLGIESIFDSLAFDPADINTTESVRFLFNNLLNKDEIKAYATYDIASSSVGVDFILDNIDDFEDVDTIQEALDLLLRVSNTVLVIQDGLIFTSDKTASNDVLFSFYGQASNLGIENIQNIKDDSDGLARLFNFWRWEVSDDDLPSQTIQNVTTVDRYGLRKEEVGLDGITNTTTQGYILNSYLDEYGVKRREMKLSTPCGYDTVRLSLFSKIDIDYPAPLSPANANAVIPIWGTGTMIWGDFYWPYVQYRYVIEQSLKWKIIGIQYNISKDLITFDLREV